MSKQEENRMQNVSIKELTECLQVYQSLTPRLRERGLGGLYMLKAAQDMVSV